MEFPPSTKRAANIVDDEETHQASKRPRPDLQTHLDLDLDNELKSFNTENLNNSSLAIKALTIVLQNWIIPDFGFYLDSLVEQSETLKSEINNDFMKNTLFPSNIEGWKESLNHRIESDGFRSAFCFEVFQCILTKVDTISRESLLPQVVRVSVFLNFWL